ncbi:MAG: hypothetical protein LBM98_10010 [Oscillospiraceae bacterium]|jgi:diacylglycerol kinase family enzyme|nr:hypothetical protein [Oscillospiraceae bacterium]
MKHFFVIDPKTFNSKAEFDAICAGIRDIFVNGGEVGANTGRNTPGGKATEMYRIFVTQRRRDPVVTIYNYLRSQSPEPVRVYAIGDDGTQSDCLNGVHNFRGAELATIPVGTFVGLNRMSLATALEYLRLYINAVTIPVDTMNCGTINALNYCAVGLQTEMIVNAHKAYVSKAATTTHKFAWVLPRMVRRFYYHALRMLSLLREDYLDANYYISVDGEEINEAFSSIFIWNAHLYPGHFCPPPEPDYQDGYMDVILLRSNGLFETLNSLKLYDAGKANDYPYNEYCFRSVRARTLEIHSNQPLTVNIDGETLVSAELTITVEPGALNYVTPQTSPVRRRAS